MEFILLLFFILWCKFRLISQFYENAEVYFQVIGRSLYIVNESTKVINETFFKRRRTCAKAKAKSLFNFYSINWRALLAPVWLLKESYRSPISLNLQTICTLSIFCSNLMTDKNVNLISQRGIRNVKFHFVKNSKK